jgi:hypothetical protein
VGWGKVGGGGKDAYGQHLHYILFCAYFFYKLRAVAKHAYIWQM